MRSSHALCTKHPTDRDRQEERRGSRTRRKKRVGEKNGKESRARGLNEFAAVITYIYKLSGGE